MAGRLEVMASHIMKININTPIKEIYLPIVEIMFQRE
jgi:hypothetical protein